MKANFNYRISLAMGVTIAMLTNFTHATAQDAKQVFIDYCAACHGEDAQGIQDQGANLVTSPFVKRVSDAELVDFIKMGRQPDAPDSAMKLLMPAFDYLEDEDLAKVIAYTRNPK
jgi:mono/diheme cytochrome c family protein